MSTSKHVRLRGAHPAYHIAGDLYVFLATAKDTNGAYSLWRAIVPPGGGPPMHVHSREDERFDVLSGRMTVWLGDETIHAGAGDSVFVERGTVHGFRNESAEPCEMLVHLCPGGMEEMLMRAGTPTEDLDSAPPPMSQSEKQRLIDLAEEYGITYVGMPVEE